MKAVSSQVRAYRILSSFAVLHSALVLSVFFILRSVSPPFWFRELWVALTTLLFFWPVVLALHPGRSPLRFIIPVVIAAALFVPCAQVYGWVAAIHIEGIHVAGALQDILHSNQRIILYSLDPATGDDSPASQPEMFQGWPVLGQAEITDRSEQQALLNALADGVRNSDGAVGLCFNPRHALHIQNGTKVVDLVICFECQQVYPYGFNKDKGFIVSETPAPVFDASLKKHGLPKAKG